MLRLDLTTEPRWLDLGHGVRLRVAPLTTALMVAARSDAAVETLPATATDEERALAFAISNPALKVLYTVLAPEEKYKAQNFNDTVVFRGGDAASGWIFNSLAKSLGLSLATVAGLSLPLALIWLLLSLMLARQHAHWAASPERRAASISRAAAGG